MAKVGSEPRRFTAGDIPQYPFRVIMTGTIPNALPWLLQLSFHEQGLYHGYSSPDPE